MQELLALCGIAVGVGLVFAALTASTSLTGSMRQLTDSVVGNATLQLTARGPDGFHQGAVAKVERIDGVKTAAPIVEARANVLGPNGRASALLIGGDTRFSRLGGTLLPRFADVDISGRDAVALPTPLAASLGVTVAQRVRLEVNSRRVAAIVGARLGTPEIGELVHHPVVLAPLATAQAIGGMSGRVTRVFVEPHAGREREVRDELAKVAGDTLDVRSADAEVDMFARAAYPTNQSTALFSVFSALVGFLFAFSAVLLTVPQRKRFITDVRMAGHDSTAVVQILLFEAVVLGVAGSVAGIALGDVLSRHLFDTTPGYLAAAFAVGSQRIVTWQSIAVASSSGLVAACIAVLVPLRDILSYRPRRKPGPPARRTSRLREQAAAGGAVCVAIATAIVAAAPDDAVAAIVALTIGFLLLLPLLLRLVANLFELATERVRSVVPTLALIEVRSLDAQARALALAATGAIAVFATVAIGGAHADLTRGLDASARDIDGNADIWVTFEGQGNILATTPFDRSGVAVAAVRDVPGVRDTSWYRGSFLDIADRRTWVIAPPRSARNPIPPSQVIRGDAIAANHRVREGGSIALSQALAADLAVGVGDRLELPSPQPTRLRVAAITTNLGWPPGAIVLNAQDYADAWASQAASALHVQLAAGASPDPTARRIEQALPDPAAMRVETRRERVERHYALTREGLSRLNQISIMVILSAILAMVATMGGMIWQRRRVLAGLKVQGCSERELWSALLAESAILLGTACVAGAAFGLYGQVILSRALEAITGFPVFYSTGGVVALTVLGLAILLALAMLVIPGWLAVRVRPQPGLPR
ncbi:MAG: FtsX-like permease family protein [Thermoleophilaceae bacterium]